MNMDTEILNWILEYFLRQPLDDEQIKFLICAFPPPKDNFNLKKLVTWKALESEVSSGSVSEKTLDLLEQLEQIESQKGNEHVSDSLKHAYCAVAVECTMKHFLNGNDDGEHSKKMKSVEFYELVKRVWKCRVERRGKGVVKGGLGSEELWLWKDEIEESVWDDNVFQSVLNKSQGLKAVAAVRDYVRVEREKLGPSYLEMIAAARMMKNSDAMRRILEDFGSVDAVVGNETLDCNVDAKVVDETPDRYVDVDAKAGNGTPGRYVDQTLDCNVDAKVVDETPDRYVDVDAKAGNGTPGRYVDQPTDVANVSNGEMQTERIQLRKKFTGKGRSRVRASRGAKLVDHDETTLGSPPSSIEFNKIRGDLATSAAELRAVVKDPLPEAMQFAEAISNAGEAISKPAGENKYHDLNNLEAESGAETAAEAEAISNDARENKCHHLNNLEAEWGDETANDHSVRNVPKPSLMEPNCSAHAYEWDESEDSPNDRVRLPTPKPIKIAPLDIHDEEKNVKKRRKVRKWSLQEEDTLREGVEKYGIGNWKVILTANRDRFQGRTEVDLKDKWRNMTR